MKIGTMKTGTMKRGPHNTPLRALLHLVENHRQAECQTILEQAKQEAERIIKTAEQVAARRKSAAEAAARSRMEKTLAAVRAQHATEIRQHRLNQTRDQLQRGFQQLQSALQQGWAEPARRMQWLVFLVDQANRFLPVGTWQIQHPQDWDPGEVAHLKIQMQATEADAPVFEADADITAGLRIGCRGAWVDGTVQGILKDRSGVEAILLALLEREKP